MSVLLTLRNADLLVGISQMKVHELQKMLADADPDLDVVIRSVDGVVCCDLGMAGPRRMSKVVRGENRWWFDPVDGQDAETFRRVYLLEQ